MRHKKAFRFDRGVAEVVDALGTSKLSNFTSSTLGNLLFHPEAGNTTSGAVNILGPIDGRGAIARVIGN
jgi:hypothetical protein